jgi:predicted enzyme related to lactoylglutathione lyase
MLRTAEVAGRVPLKNHAPPRRGPRTATVNLASRATLEDKWSRRPPAGATPLRRVALAFYVDHLGFERLEDTDLGGGKRWVRVRPKGSTGAGILLARAATDAQLATVGNQTGGRVFIFLETDDFRRDYEALVARGPTFVRPPAEEAYGTVAVFEDLYGNRFDLVERKSATRSRTGCSARSRTSCPPWPRSR